MSKHYSILILLGICLSFYAPEAKAYLDPGTGAYVFQILLGSILGLSVFVSRIIARIRDTRFLSNPINSFHPVSTHERSKTPASGVALLTKS